MRKVGVLTSGGDSPGMNACIANLYTQASRLGFELVGIKRGYQGLIEDDIFTITKEHVENVYNLGGSFIKSARSKEFTTPEGIKKAVENLNKNNIEALIVIGGNGSFRGAQDLAKRGVNIIALPGTIDNDLNYSTRSLGFDTAVSNSVEAIDQIKDTMKTNSRGAVVEVMGRNSGDIALYSAVASGADVVVVKEIPESKFRVVEAVKKAISRGEDSPLIVVAEYILDIEKLAKTLEEETDKEFRTTVLGYIQRGGAPTVFDRHYAVELAVKSLDLIDKKIYNKAIGRKDERVVVVDLKNVITDKTNFNFQLYELFDRLNS